MSKYRELAPALRATITDRKSAEAFIRALCDAGLDYHFDDGAVDCLHESNPHLSKKDAMFVDAQVGRCYDAWRKSGVDMQHDCPIGHMLDYGKYPEALAAALAMMAETEVEPTSALKQCASDHEISEGLPMASFVTWALEQPAFKGEAA